MIQDGLCITTWRARPVSFVSLMMLYESNYIRLRGLLNDARAVSGHLISRSEEDCDLHLDLVEQCRHTSILRLTYLFEDETGDVADPDLEVRVYHDARLAEASQCAQWIRHPSLRQIRGSLSNTLGERWLRNMMLNKWLDYLAERGHCFIASIGRPQTAVHEPE
jgi:uncharacterized protein